MLMIMFMPTLLVLVLGLETVIRNIINQSFFHQPRFILPIELIENWTFYLVYCQNRTFFLFIELQNHSLLCSD